MDGGGATEAPLLTAAEGSRGAFLRSMAMVHGLYPSGWPYTHAHLGSTNGS